MSELALYFKHRDIVTPGDLLARGRFRVGTNVVKVGEDSYYSTVLGSFEVQNGVLSVRALRGPYMPRKGDRVIGIVVDISMGSWSVDIRSPYEATLPAGRFPGRINPVLDDIRRYLKVGDYVYAEIAEFDRFKAPVLDATGSRELGPIKQGVVVAIEPTRVPRVIGRNGSMIKLLNNELAANIVVAQNGYVWIRAKDSTTINKCVRIIKMIEAEAHTQGLTSRVEEMLKTLKSPSVQTSVGKEQNNGRSV
ncbi:MAG: exosome complex RNA-binding protein Rrp4 [Thermoprotei archaeon]